MVRFAYFLPIVVMLIACGDTTTIQSEDNKLNAYFEDTFTAELNLFPEWQTALGIYDNNDKWNDDPEIIRPIRLRMAEERLAALENFDYDALSPDMQVSYNVFAYREKDTIARYEWRYHDYAVSQFNGIHTDIPAHLINNHRIRNKKDAQDYIARLNGVKEHMDHALNQFQMRADKGFLPPAFTFPQMIKAAQNVVTGFPFDSSDMEAPLYADFKKKVEASRIPTDEHETLLQAAQMALLQNVRPAYDSFIQALTPLGETTTQNNGVWALDESGAYYQSLLRHHTNTDLAADEIHDLGLAEVARIHAEMIAIKDKVGFERPLKDFFEFMRDDEQFYYSSTREGRQAYMTEAMRIIAGMRKRLDDIFNIKPEAPLEVKRVEPFREASAGKAFYMSPTPDGSRPGVYYANLMDMSQMPKYQMEALAYHEGIPGHHMQIAIANEREALPRFQRFTYYTAYVEGWGLYTEFLPKEMGFYQDPYSDFGRLAMELWRAARLVVDTGLHHKRWSKTKATQYLHDNTPNPTDDNTKAIERYLVYPGQATAYKIGMLKILELRTKAQDTLGEAFDIRDFHDVILQNGSVPLPLLEDLVDAYIQEASGT